MPVSSKQLQSVTRTTEVGSPVCDSQSVPQHSAQTVSQRAVEYGIPSETRCSVLRRNTRLRGAPGALALADLLTQPIYIVLWA